MVSQIGQRGEFEWCFTLASMRVGPKWTIIFSAFFSLCFFSGTHICRIYAYYIVFIRSHLVIVRKCQPLFYSFLFYFVAYAFFPVSTVPICSEYLFHFDVTTLQGSNFHFFFWLTYMFSAHSNRSTAQINQRQTEWMMEPMDIPEDGHRSWNAILMKWKTV